MSKSFKIADGFEVPVNTTTVLIAAVILIPIASQLIGLVGNLIRPKEAPICYASVLSLRPVAIQPMPDDPEAEIVNDRMPEARRAALLAQKECQPRACTPVQQIAYTRAIDSYLLERMELMARWERNYGEPGLEYGRKAFSSYQDKSLEDGFRARYASRDYKFNPILMMQREAVELLTDPARGRRYFEPCPTPRGSPTPR